ncbi:centromere-associated E [Pelobates cultripes]|uniref:Centromere-associated E n=1 Tax=Pelobates cultripes TaxID=61616 RepID=A0AAD1WEA5_PELCU|nr:centromere-associated E [Pelobates cultripes]
MNEHSSRSHTIFRMILESRERSDPGNPETCDGAVMVSHLNLVDLAGSERASQTGAEGVRLKEGCNINRSLFILGQVIKKLSDGQAGGFINYRDSKLTRILQNSLGGNTKTLIICTVTPVSFDETLSTLQFASTAKHVRNTPHVNEVVDDQALLKRYRKEIMDLKKQLEQLEASSGVRTQAMAKEEHTQLLAEIQQLQNERQNRIWNLANIIIAPSEVCEQERKAKRKRRVTWAPGKLKNSLGSSGFTDFDIFPKLSTNLNKKPKFSDLTLLAEVDDSICTEFSDFDELAPETDWNIMSKVTSRDKSAAHCHSMMDFDSEEQFPGSHQFKDSSQQKCKEMEQKIADLESQLKKVSQEYETETKERQSFAHEITNLKEQLETKEEEKNNIVKLLEHQITTLEGQLQTIIPKNESIKKPSIDVEEESPEENDTHGNKITVLELSSHSLGNLCEVQGYDDKDLSHNHSLCQEQIQMLEQKIIDLEQTIENLTVQNKQEDDGKTQNAHTQDLMETIQLCEALMTEKGNAQHEVTVMRSNFDSIILENETLKREIADLERQLNEKTETSEFEELEKETQKEHEAQLMHEIVSLKKVVENAEVYNQDLETELETRSNLLKEQEKEIIELKKNVDNLQKKMRNMDLCASMGDTDNLCEEVFQLKQSLSDAEAVTRDAQKESAFLKSENRELKEKMGKIHLQGDSMAIRLKFLKEKMSSHCQQRENDASSYEKQLESEKSKFKQMQADLQKELQCAFNEINQLTGLMAGKVPKDLLTRVELEKEISNYSKQLAKIMEEKTILEKEVACLSEYKYLPSEIEHLKHQLSQTSEELDLLKSEREQHSSIICKHEHALQEQTLQITTLTDEITCVQSKLSEAEKQHSELKRVHSELEEKYMSATQELVQKQNESECLLKEIEQHQCTIDGLEQKLSTVAEEFAQAERDKEQLISQQEVLIQAEQNAKHWQQAAPSTEEKDSQVTIPLHSLDEVTALLKERDDVQKTIEMERDDLKEQLSLQGEILQDQANVFQKEVETYKELQQDLSAEIEQLKSCLKENQQSLDVMQVEKSEVYQKLRDVQKQLEVVDQERSKLLSSIDDLKAERDDLRSDLNENIELSIETQDELRTTQQELKQQKKLVGDLRKQLEETTTTSKFCQDPNLGQELEEKLQDTNAYYKALIDEKYALETTLQSLMGEMELLRECTKAAELAQEKAEGETRELEQKLCTFEKQLFSISCERDEAKNMENNLTEERNMLKHEIEKNIKQIQCLNEELNLMKPNGDDDLRQQKLLAQEKMDLKEILENVGAESHQLKHDLQKNIEMSIETQEELQGALEELKHKTRLLDNLKSLHDITEDHSENHETDLEHKVLRLEGQMNALIQERDSLLLELKATANRKMELDELVSTLTEERNTLQEKSSDGQISVLAEQLQDIEAKYQELLCEKHLLETAHQSLKCEMELLREHVRTMGLALEHAEDVKVEAADKLCSLEKHYSHIDEADNLKVELNVSGAAMECSEMLYETQEESKHQIHLGDDLSEQILKDVCSMQPGTDFLLSPEEKVLSLKEELEQNQAGHHLEEHVQAQDRLQCEVESLLMNLQNAQSTLESCQREKHENEQMLCSLQQQMEAVTQERDEMRITQASLISERDQLNEALHTNTEMVEYYKNELQQKALEGQHMLLEKEELQETQKKLKDEVELLMKSIKDAEVTLQTVEQDKLEADLKLLNLQKEMEILAKERDELRTTQEKLTSERDQLTEDLKTNLNMIEHIETSVQQTHTEEHGTMHDDSTLELVQQGTSNDLKQLMSNLKDTEARLQNLQQDKVETEQKFLNLQNCMEPLVQERDELKLKQDTLIAERDRLQEDLKNNIDMFANIKNELHQKSLDAQQIMLEKEELELAHQRLKDDLELINTKDIEAALQNVQQEKLEIVQQLLKLQQERETLAQEREALIISQDNLTCEWDQEKVKLDLVHQKLKDEIEQLLKNMKGLEETLQSVQQDKLETEQKLINLQQQMETLTQEREELRTSQENLTSERDLLKGNLKEHIEMVMNLRNEKQKKHTEDQPTVHQISFEQVQQSCKEEMEALIKDMKQTETKLQSVQQDKLETEQKCTDLQQQMETLAQERDELKLKQDNLISERDQLKEDLKENIEMSIETQDDLRKAQEELQLQKHRVQQLTSQMSLLEEKLASVEKELIQKENALSESLKKIHENTKQEVDSKVEELSHALESSELALEQVRLENDDAARKVRDLTVELGAMSDERTHLQKLKENLKEEVNQLNNDLENLTQKHALLEAQHADENLRQEELVTEIKELKDKLEATHSRAQLLEAEKDNLQKQIQEQDLKISSLYLEQEQFQQLLQRVRSEKENIYSELQGQEKESAQLREELNKCQTELQVVKQQKDDINEHLNLKVNTLDELTKQISSLQEQIEQLQQAIKDEREKNVELNDEIERKDKDILLLNLKLSLPPEEDEEDELAKHMDALKDKTQEITVLLLREDLLVKISGVYSDQHSLINSLASEIHNEEETCKSILGQIKDKLSPTQSRSFRSLQTEHVKINSQLQTVLSKFKLICMNAIVKEEQYSLLNVYEVDLITEQKKHEELELQIQCLEQHGKKWTDSAADDLKFYELEFLNKLINKNLHQKYRTIQHVEEDFSAIQVILTSIEQVLQDETKCKQSFNLWLDEFKDENINVMKLNEGVQQENKRIIGMIQLMTKKLRTVLQSKIQSVVTEYLKTIQTELEETKVKNTELMKRVHQLSPTGSTDIIENENARLQEKLKSLQAELKKMQSRIKNLEDELDTVKADAKEKEERAAALQNKLLLNTTETELAKIQIQLTEKDNRLQTALKEIENLQSTVSKGAKPYQEEIDQLKTQVVKIEMERMKLSKSMDKEIASLKSCLEDKEECLRKLKEQLRRAQKDSDTSVCSEKDHPSYSHYPLTCGGGSGIVQSTAFLVLQSENAKLEREASHYKKKYNQLSRNIYKREDKKIKVSETPAPLNAAHESYGMLPSNKAVPSDVSPTKSEILNLYLASPGKTGMQRKREAPPYKTEAIKRVALSPSKAGRHSVASASPSKPAMLTKSQISPERTQVPLLSSLISSPCKKQTLLKNEDSPKQKFFDARSKSLPYCPTQFFDNSKLGTLPDVKNVESTAETETWWYDRKKETANECKTS